MNRNFIRLAFVAALPILGFTQQKEDLRY